MSDFAIRTIFKAQDKQLRDSVNKLDRQMNKFGKTADQAFRRAARGGKRFSDIVKGILTANIIQTGFQQIKRFFGFILGQTARMETAVATFTGLLDSMEKAEKLVKALEKLSVETSFTFTGLEESAKILLKWNPQMKELIPTLKTLGDLAQGDADKLQTITSAYAQILSRGQAQVSQLNSLADAGIPIWDILQKKFNATGRFARESIENLVSAGRLSSEELINILNTLARNNAKFVGSTLRQTQTLSGMWESLLKRFEQSANKLGALLSPVFKKLIQDFTPLLDKFNQWLDTTEVFTSANVLATFEKIKEFIVETTRSLVDSLSTLASFIRYFQEKPSTEAALERIHMSQQMQRAAEVNININDPGRAATVEETTAAPFLNLNVLGVVPLS